MRKHPVMIIWLVALIFSQAAVGCAKRPSTEPKAKLQAVQPAPVERRTPVRSPNPRTDRTGWPVVAAFGDSLTAGLGVPAEQNYPSQLQALLDERGLRYRIVNAGISGDTSAGGLNRVESVLEHKPAVVILELGANDGLQGKSVAEMKRNLAGIIERLRKAGVTVVLAGMQAPPNFGPEYTQSFHQAYEDLAKAYKIPYQPFFLEGVAGRPELNLADGIHPTPEGYSLVVTNLWTTLEPVLRK